MPEQNYMSKGWGWGFEAKGSWEKNTWKRDDGYLLNTHVGVQVMLVQPHSRGRWDSIVCRLCLLSEYSQKAGGIRPLMPPTYEFGEEGKMEGE